MHNMPWQISSRAASSANGKRITVLERLDAWSPRRGRVKEAFRSVPFCNGRWGCSRPSYANQRERLDVLATTNVECQESREFRETGAPPPSSLIAPLKSC